MVIADTGSGSAHAGTMRAAPTGDEHISSLSDLRRQIEQRHHVSARPPAHSE